ncbi:hypothetical protein GGR06_001841 [Bacteroides reticulotermitis]|uniref:Uncharacterized protein n=1 Tax=Bacteroides reticulotermitis TaxID=1133319 RepID=A0A840D6L4_9BACE|nr:hypothetical protein [Bacteroides reticulotermitis]
MKKDINSAHKHLRDLIDNTPLIFEKERRVIYSGGF